MRKNGINRELRPIDGGVCAPEGYKANAVACGIREDGGLDYGIIVSEKRCAVACMYANGDTVGGPVKVSRKNMRYGYARAMLVNGGVANCIGENSEKFAYSVCDLFFSHGLERTEIVIASTGKIGAQLDIKQFKEHTKALLDGLASTNENSLKVAEAIRTLSAIPKQLSFSFDLGDYPCKVGVIFKGGPQTSPNMATFLAYLTTDVTIATPMLQKALEAEVRETLALLNVDGLSSPNDGVFLLANGKAGNYRICAVDSEYRKLANALRLVLLEICKEIAKSAGKSALYCNVVGVKSKQTARAFAKALAGNSALRKSIAKGRLDLESIVFLAAETGAMERFSNVKISLGEKKESLLLLEDGKKLPRNESLESALLSGEEVYLTVDFASGNYKALAIGSLSGE